MYLRLKKKLLLKLVVGTAPITISGLLIMLFLLFCIVVVVGVASAIIGPRVDLGSDGSSGSTPATPGSVSISHEWKGQRNAVVVSAAETLLSVIYNCGAVDATGHNRDVCYTPGMPGNVIQNWAQSCPAGTGCYDYWQSGDLQCVTFVTGAYFLAGQGVPTAPDAVNWYSAYQQQPGWQVYTADSVPIPGDVMVLAGPYPGAAGHVMIVLDVKAPSGSTPGYVQFGQANAYRPVDSLPLLQGSDGAVTVNMTSWVGYSLLGYIRHPAGVH